MQQLKNNRRVYDTTSLTHNKLYHMHSVLSNKNFERSVIFMPIYKMEGKKDGLQKYRVRVNYTDREGKNKQLDRVAYGKEAAKELTLI